MNASTKSESTALSLPERASVALGSPAHEVKLRELVKTSAAIVTVTNKAGREECHTAYMTLKNTRVNINHTVEDVTEDAKAFTKAVKTEATRLLQIMLAEEDRLQKLRDDWDAAEEASKAAKIAAELERVAAIQKAVQSLRDMPLLAVGKSSVEISALIGGLAGAVPGEAFAEFLDDAKLARHEALDKLAKAEVVQRGIEVEAEAQRQEAARIAAELEDARLAELERIEAARIENERVSAEQARVAAAQAAEAQRLADIAKAQEAAAAAAQKAADARAQAERDEQAKAAAAQQAAIDAQLATMAEQKAALEAQQAAADLRDAEALAEQQRNATHPEALMMDAEFNVARDAARATEAERVRLQAMAEQHVSDERQPTSDLGALTESIIEDVVSDEEIIRIVADALAWQWADVIDRLQAIDFDAARSA